MKALEFYSGIGGMHAALKSVMPTAVILEAFDINEQANLVYEHNFGRAAKQANLEHITAKELDAYAADLWMLAPPCQPFTRQGKQLGAQDNRSCSFLNILEQLRAMQHPPQSLLVENVVGFEVSDMRQLMSEKLAGSGYHMQEFLLSPLQYGVPYSRPRYFCLASKLPFPVPLPAGSGPCLCTPALLLELKHSQADTEALEAAAKQHMASHVKHVQTIRQYLAEDSVQQVVPSWDVSPTQQQQQPHQQPSVQQRQHHHGQPHHQASLPGRYCPKATVRSSPADWVPETVIERHAEVIDVVSADSQSCNCFTKAYGKLARGAGSLLATVDPAALDPRWQLVNGTGSLVYNGYLGTPAYRARPAGAECSSGSSSEVTSTSIQPSSPGAVAAAGQGHSNSADEVVTKQHLVQAWKKLGLRYFHPWEIARLHSFPRSFSFPGQLTTRQCHKLLGNSLSVVVVADLLRYLLTGCTDGNSNC